MNRPTSGHAASCGNGEGGGRLWREEKITDSDGEMKIAETNPTETKLTEMQIAEPRKILATPYSRIVLAAVQISQREL